MNIYETKYCKFAREAVNWNFIKR